MPRTRRFVRATALSFPFAALFALGAPSANAAEWLPAADGAPSAQSAAAAASAYLTSHAALRLEGIELRPAQVLPMREHKTVRFSQLHRSLPVWGAGAAVRLTGDGRVKLVVLDVARRLPADVTPALTPEDAAKAVSGRFGALLPTDVGAMLGIVADEEGGGRLAYRLDVPTARGGVRYLVDAKTGEVFGERGLAVDVAGRVYPVSSVNTPTPMDVELPDLVASTPQVLTGWNGNLVVTNYASGDAQNNTLAVVQDLQPNSGADFLYDPPADPHDKTDGFAQVGIYYHLTRIRDFATTTLGLDMSAASWKVVGVANYSAGGPVDNAFFSPAGISGAFSAPNLIAIGQGTTLDFADDSDVFLHEFTHYLSSNAIGYSDGQLGADEYGLSTFGGSIDEGTADYFACTLNGDPILGEASLAPFGAERDLTDTSAVCPDSLLGEVHEDGKLAGSIAWSVREAFGSERADQLVWGAMSLLPHNPSFGDLGRGLQATMDDLIEAGTATQADRDTLDALLAKRGLDDCDKVLDLGGGKDRNTIMFGLDVIAQAFGSSCQQIKDFVSGQSLFHFSATPSAGDTSLRFSVELSGGSSELDWGIYVRADQHVGFSGGGGVTLPKVSKYDYAVEHITATSGELVLDATSNPPFDPSKTYYLVIGHQNCPTTVAKVSAGVVPPSTGEGGAGGAGGGGATVGSGGEGGTTTGGDRGPIEVDDGCGCAVPGDDAGSDGAAGLLLLGLAAAAAGRRRRASAD